MGMNNPPSEFLHVALIQPDLIWHEPQANLRRLSSSLLIQISQDTDLIILPEMFTSGFTQHPEKIVNSHEEGERTALGWMREQAHKYNAAVAGSIAYPLLASAENETSAGFSNRLLFVYPSGEVQYYDKWHLFKMAGEHKRYQAGDKRCIITLNGWRILLTICYDLRFPIFCRNNDDYDVMICVANWPEARRHAWRTLLQARAIENQAYVLGVNRVGEDGLQQYYSGDSMIVDYQGHILMDGASRTPKIGDEHVLAAALDYKKLQDARKSFPVLEDADSFKIL